MLSIVFVVVVLDRAQCMYPSLWTETKALLIHYIVPAIIIVTIDP